MPTAEAAITLRIGVSECGRTAGSVAENNVLSPFYNPRRHKWATVAAMKIAVGVFLMAMATVVVAQQSAPDVSGTWVATTEVPAGLAVAPSAIMGAKFAMSQTPKTVTLLRPRDKDVMTTTLEIGGPEVRTMVSGATCMGDSAMIETAAIEGNALLVAWTGVQSAGAAAPTKTNARRLFRRLSSDTLLVEATTVQNGQARQIGTVYKKSADVIAPPAPRPVQAVSATIGATEWMAGNWISAGPNVTEERWTSPAGGSMLAVARDLRGAAMASFEFLCIVERGGTLVYTAMPNARTPATDFTLSSITDSSATFENPSHDYPKKIRYSRLPDGSLQTEVSGAPGSRTITVTLKR